jgi:diguanylate cyclase (GGDEF)-like protein
MNSPSSPDLRLTLERWRAEHERVADEACATNLDRTRVLSPVVAVVNGVLALVFLVLALKSPADDPTYRWKLGLVLVHTGMGLAMLGCAWAARALRHGHRTLAGRWLGFFTVGLALAFAIAAVAIDQWVTPNITPFLVACMVASLVLYMRPLSAAALYLLAYGGFHLALGWTQLDPGLLLSNRLSGFAACGAGWALSVLLWRKFTVITLQQEQIDKTQAELQQKQRELERLTRQDGLTGLFNRNTFVELSRRELDRAQRQGSATTILLLDLDHFKRVNDTWGHPAGDAVLRHVATLASTTVRSTDLVGRLGGEEFIVLLPNTSAEAGRKLAEKLRVRLEASVVLWEGTRIPVTASIGLSNTTVEEKRDFDTLYTEADKALYLAKQRGRNRVV